MTTRAAEPKCMKHWNRLSARLDLGLTCKLTLLTAPEGFGKSSLLAHWADGVPAIVGLIDLDHNTDAPTLITSMAHTLHELLPTHVPALPTTETPCEELLVDLINAIATVPHDLAIILDDYRSDPRLDECLGFLLEYLPPQMHLYIAGEAMPSVSSLPRLRVRRQLIELTETDLGLTVPEVGSMLTSCLDCQVDPEEVVRLVALTHGSIADLRALIEKIRGSDDPLEYLKTLVTSPTAIST
jgi:LuxR family transcriptional regulator, maltose regulon positive regulatory protein